MAVTSPRPHDLIQVFSGAPLWPGAPGWVHESLASAPWVVVRHDAPCPGHIPVGVRGPARELRWATYLPRESVADVRTPESLRDGGDWSVVADVAAVRSLRNVMVALGRDTCWGPTGSVGFTLASGRPVVTATSDLDLVVRCPERPTKAWLADLASLFAMQEVRVDCQVETPAGLTHLDEVRRGGPSLVRTASGPALCTDPWARVA